MLFLFATAGWPSARRLCFFNKHAEGWCVIDCQLGEHLAVDFNAGFFQTIDQPAILEALGAAGGIDALRPKNTVLAFLLLAANVCVSHGAVNGNVSLTNQFAAIAAIALG